MEVVIAPTKWKKLQPKIIENSSASTVTDIHRGLTFIN